MVDRRQVGVKCFSNQRRHWSECVGRINKTFCFTGASYRAQLLKGRLVLNPGLFFFLQKHFFFIIFSVIFKSIQ